MTIDPLATAGLVAREVRTGSRDASPTKIVVTLSTKAKSGQIAVTTAHGAVTSTHMLSVT